MTVQEIEELTLHQSRILHVKFLFSSFFSRSMLPVPPNVAPAISLELDVDDGEVENYEVRPSSA